MSEFYLILGLMASALAFVSFLLYIHLSSQGVARPHIAQLISEVWGTFVLIGVAFAVGGSLIRPTAQTTLAREFGEQFARIRQLSAGQQALLIGILLLAGALFAHLLWSLRAAQREAQDWTPPSEGGLS